MWHDRLETREKKMSIRRRISFVACPLAAFIVALLVSADSWAQRVHELMPSPQTVHMGHFNAALKPVLTIDSGDIVVLESVGALEPSAIDESGVVPPSAVPEYVRAIYRDVKDRGPAAHVLTGPIAVNGASILDPQSASGKNRLG
jgi:hypothetical protein